MSEKRFPVVELFGPTLQGEGALAGQRTMFIRFAYCDGTGDGWCKWCDSRHAIDPYYKDEWHYMSAEEIVDKLQEQSLYCRNVTLSGGNPALHDLDELVILLHQKHYLVHVETQGTVFKDWLCWCDTVIVSPKPPSAGSHDRDCEKFRNFMHQLNGKLFVESRVVVKVVVDPDVVGDYEYARNALNTYGPDGGRYLSVLTKPLDTSEDILERYRRLAERVCADPVVGDVAVLPQLHVLLWGHRRGV